MTMAEGDLAVAEMAFVRRAPIAPRPPPAAMTGALGWLRANLFSDAVQHRADDSDRAAARLGRSPTSSNFCFIDAVWSGDRPRRLPAESVQHREVGACWPFVWERLPLLHLRLLSDPRALARRCVLRDAGGRGRLAAVARTRRAAISAPSISSWSCRSSSFILLTGWSAIGLEPVDTVLWGGMLVTLVVASVGIVFSLPLGILLALGRRSRMPAVRLFSVIFIEFVRGVPLITVLFMASVMLPLFLPEQLVTRQAAARADRHRAVRVRLHGRGGARRPAGDPEGPVRRRHGARAWLLADDALIILPQALKIDDPEHRQHLHRPVQGHDAGLHRRHLRSPAHDRSGAHRSELGDAGHQHDRLCLRRDLLSRLLLRHVALFARDGSAACARATGGEGQRMTADENHGSLLKPARLKTRIGRRDHRAATSGTASSTCCATSTSRSSAASAS